MVEGADYIAILNQISAQSYMEIVSVVSRELGLCFKLVDSLAILELDLFDLVEPGYVELDVGVGNSAATILVDAHLDLGHGQV